MCSRVVIQTTPTVLLIDKSIESLVGDRDEKSIYKMFSFCEKKNNKRYVYERLNILDILVLLQMKTLSRFIVIWWIMPVSICFKRAKCEVVRTTVKFQKK